MTNLCVQVADKRWQSFIPAPKRWMNRVMAIISSHMPEENPMALTVLLSTDEHIQKLNHTFRGKSTPTNVLSFPDPDPEYLGDIILALETCEREAISEGKTMLHHATHLLIHGTLHLLGYDHQSDLEAEAMENMEIALLQKLDIPNPYKDHP
jgi:probable rRNA maturation factor